MAKTTQTTISAIEKVPVRTKRSPSKVAATETPAKRAKAAPVSSEKPKAVAAGKGRTKTPPAPIKPVKAPVVTMKQLAATLAESRDMPKRDAEAFVAELISVLVGHIKDGAKVRIAGLGVLEVKDRPARMARNPATGEQVHVEASRKVAFRAAKDLKEAI